MVSERPVETKQPVISVSGPSKTPPTIVVPEDVATDLQAMYSNEEMRSLRNQLQRFSTDLRIHKGPFAGTLKSYAGKSAHPDYERLVKYGRMVPYDVAVSIFAI